MASLNGTGTKRRFAARTNCTDADPQNTKRETCDVSVVQTVVDPALSGEVRGNGLLLILPAKSGQPGRHSIQRIQRRTV